MFWALNYVTFYFLNFWLSSFFSPFFIVPFFSPIHIEWISSKGTPKTLESERPCQKVVPMKASAPPGEEIQNSYYSTDSFKAPKSQVILLLLMI
jgi:hypothetical protein